MRTKYDRMFERKNQNILSEHYASIIDHSADGDDGDDDFLTLKRADHDLGETEGLPTSADLSKRKLKMGESRKAALKLKGVGSKLRFDDEGEAHELYELVDETEEKKTKKGDEKERFVEEEKKRLAERDVVDREVAKEKKREKKRKRKEREREEEAGYGGGGGAELAGSDDDEDDDGGFPEIDITGWESGEGEEGAAGSGMDSDSDDEAPNGERPAKKQRNEEFDEDELALRLLEG